MHKKEPFSKFKAILILKQVITKHLLTCFKKVKMWFVAGIN